MRMNWAAGLTPARLGAVVRARVRQRGAGACGTVDCCHERESQTHLWEAPSGGPHRPFAQGAHQPHLTTEHAHTGLPVGRPVVARSDRASTPSGFTSQPQANAALAMREALAAAGLVRSMLLARLG